MKERPILFSAPMVRAILEGRKTQTRRVMKQQLMAAWRKNPFSPSGLEDGHGRFIKFPYGQPGDRLWVRETWSCLKYQNIDGDEGWRRETLVFRASIPHGNLDCHFKPWRPSIHMPRWASRITLEVTGIRVEKLQEISRQDAKAEGFLPGLNGLESWAGQLYGNAQLAFQACWKSINGPGSWDANPWVWVVEFKKLEGMKGTTL